MGIRVGRDTAERIAVSSGTFALQVQQPDDPGAAIAALKLARVDVLGLAAGRVDPQRAPDQRPTVSPVVNAPNGPVFLVEHFDFDADVRAAIPDAVVRRLEKAGLEQATLVVPRLGGLLDGLERVPNAVVLRLFPVPRGAATALPPDWLDMAGEWVTGDLDDASEAMMRVLGVDFRVPGADVPAVLHECGLAKAWCDAVNGALDDRVRTASLTFGRLPHLALAAAGPHVDNGGLLARFHLLEEIARELAADVAYACIDFEPSLEGLATGLSPLGWQREGGAPANLVARDLVDERVPDAYPYQVLGPGHLALLDVAALPAEPLGDGRVEVHFDEPASWLVTNALRDEVQEQAWELLAPCLVADDDLAALVEERTSRTTRPEPATDPVDLPALGSIPDLDAIVLERHTHPRRGTRLSFLELVSWLNHENHSDGPACVSPVLSTYARWLAAGLDDETRQTLKALAPRLIGTAPASAEDEEHRQWLAVDQLVRVQVPAWLRAAGMAEAADRLSSLGSLTQHLELVRAVDILGTAITTASRRIDITASIVGDDRERDGLPDDQLVWRAWELVTESTGWVAASEAATLAAPAELTYATDLRVIECSRDPRVREELETARQSVGDSAWTTALHAVADEAWDRAWRAADSAARELSGFTVRVEMGRIAKATFSTAGGWNDLDEPALDLAERAARDSLTRAVLSGGAMQDGEHPWDAARNAARGSEGGREWSIVNDEARRAIGEDAWAQAMADARAAVTDLLEGASSTVARVVVAAVAREASSAAARGLALRAASVARANGGDDEEAQAAADAALEVVAVGLQREALLLLERMIDPTPVPAATPDPSPSALERSGPVPQLDSSGA